MELFHPGLQFLFKTAHLGYKPRAGTSALPSLAFCHCECGKRGANADRTPHRGTAQPRDRRTKTSRPLLLVPRIFVPCKVCESCWEDRSRFCLNSHRGSEAVLPGNTENVASPQLGAGPCPQLHCSDAAGHSADSSGHSHLTKPPFCWGCCFSILPPHVWALILELIDWLGTGRCFL